MSLKFKFLGIGTISSLLAIALAIMSIVGEMQFTKLITESETASLALRNHMLSDMLHDGLRSDVYRALHAAENAPEERAEVLAGVKEHAELFRNSVSGNKKLALPEQVKNVLSELDIPLKAYISMSEAIVVAAFEDRAKALELLPKFNKDFSVLEDAMEHASGVIESEVTSSTKHAHSLSAIARIAMIAALIAAVLIGAGITFYMWRALAVPLIGLAGIIRRLGDGETDMTLPESSRKDEIGDMMRTVVVFRDNAIKNKELAAAQKIQEQKAEKENERSLHEVATRFEESVGEIINAVSNSSMELNTTAQSMSSIAEETSNQAAAVSAASMEASANVQTVASATEEMSNTIQEINQQVLEASEASKKAVADVATTAKQMSALAETGDKIGEVVSLISDIAEQTNLLALNATIESARAGEAGKGFAVVASEVKALASETAKATENISSHIADIQSATSDAVISIDGIGKVIRHIEESSTAIAAAMEEQGATTQEVARNVQEASSGTQEVTANIEGVTKASQESSVASDQVSSAADALSKQAEALTVEVTGFLQNLRQGPADRRASDDPNYKGEDRRGSLKERAA